MNLGPLRLQLVLLFRGQASSSRPGNQILTGSVVSFSSSLHFVKLQTVAAYLCCLTGASCDICLTCCRARKGSTMIAAYWLLGFEELKALPGVWQQKGDSSVLLQGDLTHKYGYEHIFRKKSQGKAHRMAPTSGRALALLCALNHQTHIARVSEAFHSCGYTDRLVFGYLTTPSEDSRVKIPCRSGQTFSWLLHLHLCTRLAAQDSRRKSDGALALRRGTWRQGRWQKPIIPKGKRAGRHAD